MNTLNRNIFSNNTSFLSRRNPIEPYTVESKKGKINIAEIDYDKDINQELIHDLNLFLCNNLKQNSRYIPFIKINSGTPEEKKKYLAQMENDYAETLHEKQDDEDFTLLIGRDDEGNIQAACMSYGFNEIPKGKESALYIDAIAVSPELRGLNMAKNMLSKTFDANKNTFNDVFLASTPMAEKFYEKLGFEPFDETDEDQKTVSDEIYKRVDYMDCLKPYNKPLQEDKPRWYTICADAIRAENE